MAGNESDMLIFDKPVLGFAAYSGTGKTTLLVKLLPLLKRQGLRIAMIKQTHHDFEIDKPGKDSYELRMAGADQMLLASEKRSALITEHEEPVRQDLKALVKKLDLEDIDLVLVEGFKNEPFARIELHRASVNKELMCNDDDSVIAVASDAELDVGKLTLLDINSPEQVAGFINSWLNSQS